MILNPSRTFPERFVALAIGMVSDRGALEASGAPLPIGTRAGQPVVELSSAAALSFSRFEDGRLRRVAMRSFDAVGTSEVEALTGLDRDLARHHYLGATLIAFDAPGIIAALARRARRHWLFEQFRVPRWEAGGPGSVVDVRDGWDPGVTLWEACAASGIRGAGSLHAHSGESGGDGPAAVPAPVRRVEAAALATTLLMAHSAAAGAGSPAPLLRTWWDLLTHVREALPRLAHCASFRCDGRVDPDLYSVVGVPLARRRRPAS